MKIDALAPVVVKSEIEINSPVELVWRRLTDINHWPVWNDRIIRAQIAGKPEVGSEFKWSAKGSRIRSSIHTYTPNESFGWTGKALGSTAIHNWYIESTKNRTIVRVEESMDGWLVRLMKAKLTSILKDDMDFWLDSLKAECERTE